LQHQFAGRRRTVEERLRRDLVHRGAKADEVSYLSLAVHASSQMRLDEVGLLRVERTEHVGTQQEAVVID
jgi:hypothetical protein